MFNRLLVAPDIPAEDRLELVPFVAAHTEAKRVKQIERELHKLEERSPLAILHLLRFMAHNYGYGFGVADAQALREDGLAGVIADRIEEAPAADRLIKVAREFAAALQDEFSGAYLKGLRDGWLHRTEPERAKQEIMDSLEDTKRRAEKAIEAARRLGEERKQPS